VPLAALAESRRARELGRSLIWVGNRVARPPVVIPPIGATFKDREQLEVDIDSGAVKNLTTGNTLKAEALPPIEHILKQGGLVEVTKAKLAASAGPTR